MLLRETAARFEQCGIPDPMVDAALLMSHLTGRPMLELRLDSAHEPDAETLAAYEALCSRRMSREPLQYILGTQPFLGRMMRVDSRVLIPRPETELLCEHAIAALKRLPSPTALDLCCGSGCIAVSLALEAPHAQIHACDLSGDALDVTRLNAQAHGARLTLHQGDLFDAVRGLSFDVIVSNPPYIASAECSALQQEVLREPLMALDGGADGYDFYRRIARDAPRFLKRGGTLLLEVGFSQAEHVARLLRETGFARIAIERDLQQVDRMVIASLGAS